jgi:hypothetical protein
VYPVTRNRKRTSYLASFSAIGNPAKRQAAKPRGNSVKGTIDYDFGGNNGTLDFEGERLPENEKQESAE